MTATPAELQRDMHLRIVRRLGRELAAGAAVLDFGCGAGQTVEAYGRAGFDAWGCDIDVGPDPHPRALPIEGPYRVPFDDDSFDFVFSDQVLEHVQDWEAAVREIARVLRPAGFSLHVFPGRWRPVEPHTFVPLAGLVTARPWLRLWAALGVRNGFQKGLAPDRVVDMNARYLACETAYPSRRAVAAVFSRRFGTVRFCEAAFFASSWGRGRVLAPVARLPAGARVLSAVHSRALWAERPLGP